MVSKMNEKKHKTNGKKTPAQASKAKTIALKHSTPHNVPTGTVIPMFGNEGGPALKMPEAEPVAAPKTIADITPAWAVAKAMETRGKNEADACRKKIMAVADNDEKALIGYKDDNLEITGSPDIAYDDPKLVTVLKEQGVWDAVTKPKPVADLVKSVALTNPAVQAVLDDLAKNKKMVWKQVKDKDTE